MLTKKQEERLLFSIDEKIREAEEYFIDDEDITEEEIKGYVNGLEMAKLLIQEHDYMWQK